MFYLCLFVPYLSCFVFFAFVDLSVEDINPKKSIEWKLEKLEDYVYNNFLSVKSWGVSINNNF